MTKAKLNNQGPDRRRRSKVRSREVIELFNRRGSDEDPIEEKLNYLKG